MLLTLGALLLCSIVFILWREKKISDLVAAKKYLEKNLQEQKEYFQELKTHGEDQFENLAQKIFEEKTKSYETRSQDSLQKLLDPLKEQLRDFRSQVESTYQNEARERFALKKEIERITLVSQEMTLETKNLTQALRSDQKTQGVWGELVLQRILEASGLREGEEFITQGSAMGLKNEEGGHLKPDILVRLPEEKFLIIDAKTSLTSLTRLSACEGEAYREESKKFLTSLKNHVDNLAGKKYQFESSLKSPEFVLMFIPSESAFSLALQLDPQLFTKAWDKMVVIVGPTTLLATLKTVASIWKRERQGKNALKIAQECGKLYDKFALFLNDVERVGESLKKSQDAYSDLMSKARHGRGNIISRLEKIKNMGIKHQKNISTEGVELYDPRLEDS